MSVKIYKNGSWQDANKLRTYQNGTWQDVKSGKVCENGIWKEVYPNIKLPTLPQGCQFYLCMPVAIPCIIPGVTVTIENRCQINYGHWVELPSGGDNDAIEIVGEETWYPSGTNYSPLPHETYFVYTIARNPKGKLRLSATGGGNYYDGYETTIDVSSNFGQSSFCDIYRYSVGDVHKIKYYSYPIDSVMPKVYAIIGTTDIDWNKIPWDGVTGL